METCVSAWLRHTLLSGWLKLRRLFPRRPRIIATAKKVRTGTVPQTSIQFQVRGNPQWSTPEDALLAKAAALERERWEHFQAGAHFKDFGMVQSTGAVVQSVVSITSQTDPIFVSLHPAPDKA